MPTHRPAGLFFCDVDKNTFRRLLCARADFGLPAAAALSGRPGNHKTLALIILTVVMIWYALIWVTNRTVHRWIIYKSEQLCRQRSPWIRTAVKY
jgi:hypothetical protein